MSNLYLCESLANNTEHFAGQNGIENHQNAIHVPSPTTQKKKRKGARHIECGILHTPYERENAKHYCCWVLYGRGSLVGVANVYQINYHVSIASLFFFPPCPHHGAKEKQTNDSNGHYSVLRKYYY